jgi:CBS domain-containing protein
MLRIRNVLEKKGTDIWSVAPASTAYEALEIMADKNIGALMVVREGKLVGVFSERDYARKVILKGRLSKDTLIAELMTRDVYSVTPDDTIEECMALMSAAHCRHMPVLENDQLIGVVSIGDIVNAIIDDQDIKIQDLKNYISGGYYALKTKK